MRIKVIDFLYCNHLLLLSFEALDSILYIIVYPDYALRSISICGYSDYSCLWAIFTFSIDLNLNFTFFVMFV